MHLFVHQILTIFTMLILTIKYVTGKNVGVNVCVYLQYITDHVLVFVIY